MSSDGWQSTSFGKIAILRRDPVAAKDIEGDSLYVGLEHIGQGTLSLQGVGRGKDVASGKSRFVAGDVLFGKLRPYFRKVVRPAFDGVCSTDIWVIRAREQVDPRFLFYLVAGQDFVDYANSGSSGTRMPRANWSHVEEFRVALPPLEEQRAIAEVLGSLDAAIENHLAQHRGRVNLLMNLVTAPHHKSIVGGFELTIGGDWGADEPDDSHTEAALCLRGKDLEELLSGAADDIPVRYLKPSSVKKRRLQPGDVLTAGSGTLGPTLLITESLLSGFSLPAVYSNFVKRIRVSSADAEPVGLFAALHGMWKSGSINQFRTGTAMPNLDAKALVRNLVTPGYFEDGTGSMIDDLLSFDDIAAVRTLRSTRDALLTKLISGELRIEDPQRILDQVA